MVVLNTNSFSWNLFDSFDTLTDLFDPWMGPLQIYLTHRWDPYRSIKPMDGALIDLFDSWMGFQQIYLTHWLDLNKSIWSIDEILIDLFDQ